MTKRFQILLCASCLLLITIACDRERNDKGYEYFPDMAHSLAYETYAPNPALGPGQSMLPPPPNSIPLEMIPYRYPATQEGRLLASSELNNPLELTEDYLIRGKREYVIFCEHCHGATGKGDGYLYTSGKYKYPPASLISEKMLATNDADIYHVITAGYQLMGAHGHMIKPLDRWMIAMFVKNELQKK